MKNLSIAGTVNSSKLVDLNGKQFLEINVALNHVTPCEWIKVLSQNTALTIEKGSRISAYGNPEEKAYIDVNGKPMISRTLWAAFCEVLYTPKPAESQSNVQPVAQATSAHTVLAKKQSSKSEKNELEAVIEQINNAISIKQCNYLFYNFVKKLSRNEDQEIALSALLSRKKLLGAAVKKAA